MMPLKQKIELIKEAEDNPSKLRKRIANEFGIPCSILSTILTEKCRQQYFSEGNVARLWLRGVCLQDTDQALFCCFREAGYM